MKSCENLEKHQKRFKNKINTNFDKHNKNLEKSPSIKSLKSNTIKIQN